MEIVSFYTIGTIYEQEARRLRASLKAMRIPSPLICPVRDRGNWQDNVARKAEFLAAVRRNKRGLIVWLDADAVVHRDFRSDVAALMDGADVGLRPRREVYQTGTVALADSQACRGLLDKWVERNREKQNKGGGQQALNDVLARSDAVVADLPVELCCIFDMDDCEDPAIEHLQASRDARNVAGKHQRERRHARVTHVESGLAL